MTAPRGDGNKNRQVVAGLAASPRGGEHNQRRKSMLVRAGAGEEGCAGRTQAAVISLMSAILGGIPSEASASKGRETVYVGRVPWRVTNGRHNSRDLAAPGAVAMTAVIASCGAGGAGGGAGAASSCAATLKFHRQVYSGTSLRTHPPYTRVGRIPVSHMRGIGERIFPPCNDTNHSHDVAQPVRVAGLLASISSSQWPCFPLEASS
jgi:hypothetical protein